MDMPNPFTLPMVDFIGGSNVPLTFNTFVKEDGEPFDLTNCTATFSIINYVNQSGPAIFSKAMTIEDGVADSGGEVYPSVAKVTLDSADTADLYGKYIYQISVRDSNGKFRFYQGVLFIFRNIDQSLLA